MTSVILVDASITVMEEPKDGVLLDTNTSYIIQCSDDGKKWYREPHNPAWNSKELAIDAALETKEDYYQGGGNYYRVVEVVKIKTVVWIAR